MREDRNLPTNIRHPGEGRDPRTPRSEILDPGLRRDDGVSKEACSLTNPFGLSLSKPSLSFYAGQEGKPFDRLRANGALNSPRPIPDRSGVRARDQESGFTLVELMVALVIFAMLSAAGVALLSFSVRAQAAAVEERFARFARDVLGGADPDRLRRAQYALADAPIAAVRPHLANGEALQPVVDDLVRETFLSVARRR